MPEQSSLSVAIAAQPAEILAVLGDFAAYPDWAESITVCQVLSRHGDGAAELVRFVVAAGISQEDFVLAYTWDESRLRVDWQPAPGQPHRSRPGGYVLLPKGRETQVTCTLVVDPTVPRVGPFKRRAERAIIEVTLRSLKKRVEGGR